MQEFLEDIVEPQSFFIPETFKERRLSQHPPEFRSTDFDRVFDSCTFIYDCALNDDGTEVLLVAPKLNNMRKYAERARFTAIPSMVACGYTIDEMHNLSQFRINIPLGTTLLHFQSELGAKMFRINEIDAHFFKGRRVATTMSRNNELVWIRDWITYYQKVHQADAALIFDNGSDRYTIKELLAALTGIPGIARLRVVSWPFPFGPIPRNGFLAKTDAWEDFCQFGALETAHWRFLKHASSVVSCDVDELMLPMASGTGIFEAVEREPTGIIMSDWQWTILVLDAAGRKTPGEGRTLRHLDFRVTLKGDRTEGGPKWALVPSIWPGQWQIHFVAPLNAETMPELRARHRHFRQLSTNWYNDRSAIEPFDPERHFIDDELISALSSLRSA
jgi:hypothetical protein